jgi:hypothetical protein
VQIQVFFGQKSLIPIADLFNFSNQGSWGEFWSHGVKNYEQEMGFYDLLAQGEGGDGKEAASGGPGDPIKLDTTL